MVSSILVSGANKGIGLEAVRILSERLPATAHIFMGSRNLDNATAALQTIRENNPTHAYTNIFPLQLDVTSRDSIAAAVARVQREVGTLDVLINNSGIAAFGGPNGPAVSGTDVFAVNVVGVKNLTEAFWPVLTPGKGHVVIVASEVGAWTTHALDSSVQQKLEEFKSLEWSEIEALMADWCEFAKGGKSKYVWPKVETTFGAYGISKALVLGYTRKLAFLHPEMKVNAVCPGYCATALNGFHGFRTPAVGGESVIWPVFNECEQGSFYRDGKKHAFKTARPSEIPK
ncbi:hypothetical protein HDU98_006550 [Podochytrium sp. JEL0797]|nr:hypothetical protein HDU98_006550 [Podochytrium sp. JEL0797]